MNTPNSSDRPTAENQSPADTPALPKPTDKPSDTAIGPEATDGGILGTIEVLSEAEMAELMACETVIEGGWATFVQVGLAFARVRDSRLYRTEFANFEEYCRAKWQCTRRHVNHLISAAQIVSHLGTSCSLTKKPHSEAQVRPLVGLTLEQAQAAWIRAVELAGNTRITARVVKRAREELNLAPEVAVEPSQKRPNKSEICKGLRSKLEELLHLLRQETAYPVLIQKVEEMHVGLAKAM